MNLEKSIELKGWTAAHQLPSTKNDDIVCDNCKSSMFERRHWSHSWLEIKVFRMESCDGREDLVEDGP